MPSWPIPLRAWNIFTFATYFSGRSPTVRVKASVMVERAALGLRPQAPPHSTVTLFARFRGLSTSAPRASAA